MPKKRKPVYNGAFLKEGEAQRLRAWLATQLPWSWRGEFCTSSLTWNKMEREGKWYCHHATHAFKPKGEDLNLPYGEEVELTVVGITHTLECVALMVETPLRTSKFGGEELAHITIWTAEGVPPKRSNEQIDEMGYSSWDVEYKVKCRVGYFNGKEVIYSAPKI